MPDSLRIIIAATLSIIILIVWETFFAMPQFKDNATDQLPTGMEAQVATCEATEAPEDLPEKYIEFNSQSISGRINLLGAKIDTLYLQDFQSNNLPSDCPDYGMQLFFPGNQSNNAYFATFGWLASKDNKDYTLPTAQTLWDGEKQIIDGKEHIILSWQNEQAMKFTIDIEIADKYLFKTLQKIENNSNNPIKLQAYSLISRTQSEEGEKRNMMVHEGGIIETNNVVNEYDFSDIAKTGQIEINKTSGWAGFSDKYWLAALAPKYDNYARFARFYKKDKDLDQFQLDFVSQIINIAPKDSHSTETLLFAGAKELKVLDKYRDQYSLPMFDRTVDFGILYFLTKPIFFLLSYFYSVVGNFGIAILLLTVVIKALLFPLAFKGFKAMNRLKDLQPKVEALRKKFTDKPEEFQKAVVALYKKEKVNPLSGCLPLLLQMPVFFALYKVLYVNIEMHNAPFFWWIKDLSAPDPLSVFNLFGLIDWNMPAFLNIGILPILMALSMYVQQQLSPAPADPLQAKMMKLLPVIFLVMFASFPSGLIIYITWSNILSIVQQLMIKKLSS